MKNMDWGAIAYLTQSKYRKEGEVWANSNTAYKTGCAGSSVSATNESICNEYYTELGQNASTTGNIYGIYDMSGGIHEYVMGGMYNLDEITILVKSSGFNQTTIDSIDMQKYINKYAYGTTIMIKQVTIEDN